MNSLLWQRKTFLFINFLSLNISSFSYSSIKITTPLEKIIPPFPTKPLLRIKVLSALPPPFLKIWWEVHYECAVFKKEMFLLCPWGNVLTLQTPHMNFLILCQIVLHPNISFLISKQNKAPKNDPKMLTQ